MDFVDGVVEQKRAMPWTGKPESMDWSTWDAYFRFLYRSSPVLQEYVRDNLDYYPDYIFAVLGHLIVREPDSGTVTSRWVASEVTDPDGAASADRLLACRLFGDGALQGARSGYPWIRPWLFHLDEEGWDADPSHQEAPSPPTALAVVTAVHARAGGGVTAEVVLRSRGAIDPPAIEALRQWVCSTLSASRQLTVARLRDAGAGEESVREYDLTRTVPAIEAGFLVPLHPAVGATGGAPVGGR